jgi:predicted outer membrane lipoprotein
MVVMNPTLKLGLMVAGAYAVLYAVSYVLAELTVKFTKEN